MIRSLLHCPIKKHFPGCPSFLMLILTFHFLQLLDTMQSITIKYPMFSRNVMVMLQSVNTRNRHFPPLVYPLQSFHREGYCMVCKQALMKSCVDVPCGWLKALLPLSWSAYSSLKQLQFSPFTGSTDYAFGTAQTPNI